MTAPCGHDECGLLCDDMILAERLALRQAKGEAPSLTVAHLRAEGLLAHGRRSYGDVARVTGLSHQTVGRLARKLGVCPPQARRGTDESQGEAIVALHEQGLSVRGIARELGMPKSVVHRRLSQVVQQREGDLVGSVAGRYQGG